VSENESLRDTAKRKRAKAKGFVLELVVKLLAIGFLLFLGFKVMPELVKSFMFKQS